MGYKGWHDHGVCVNVHVGCKNPDITELRSALQSSESIANFVTLENDEFCWGAKEIVETFGDLVPVVLDVHHYWIMRDRRILPNSSLVVV
jgi:UV DNA damage repair endonuclease